MFQVLSIHKVNAPIMIQHLIKDMMSLLSITRTHN